MHIHLKDVRRNVLKRILQSDASFNSGVREGSFTVPGDGDVDFSELGKFVRNSDYRGWVIVEAEQDPAKAPPKVYAGKAYRFAKNLIF
jgi:inosose dehydratase